MAADAQGEGIVLDLLPGKGLGGHVLPRLGLLPALKAAGGVHPDVQAPLPVLVHAPAHGLQQQRLAPLGPPDLGKGVQLLPPDGQQGLDVQHRAHGRHRRGDPAAPLEVLQGVHADVDLLGHGDLVVVRHLHPAAIALRQDQRRLAGAAQAAGHGDVDQLVPPLRQQAVPDAGEILRRGLGCGDAPPLPQVLIELLRAQIHALIVDLVVNDDRHGNHPHAPLGSLLLGDAAVAVGDNRRFHANSSFPAAVPLLCTQYCTVYLFSPGNARGGREKIRF